MESSTKRPNKPQAGICCSCSKVNSKTKSKKPKKILSHSALRVACPVAGCKSTFTRPSDLSRHQKSIHGPKTPCVYPGCMYVSGRTDKIKEHVKKMHQATGESASDNLLDCKCKH